MNRSELREEAFKLLYSKEVQGELEKEQVEEYIKDNNIDKPDYIFDIINGISNNIDDINQIISNNLKSDWKIDRISKINLALLKLSIYEIKYKELPYKVVINEVVELAKKFGEDTSANFINGVLANVVKDIDE
ncbi:MAG: transcription antitermination factor NusB [Clostridia bacterium]|nr:transcription antitermination factor NusB [Clostridia bacterium]